MNTINTMDLNFIDKIYCISLDTSTERRKLFEERLPELVTLPNFEWYIVKKNKENPIIGCATSHLNLIRQAKQNGYRCILILEDDAKLMVPWDSFLKYMGVLRNDTFNNTFNNTDVWSSWRFIQLGSYPIKTTETKYSNLLQVRCSYDCHSYLVNLDRLDNSLLDYYESMAGTGKIPIDAIFFCNNILYDELIKKPYILNDYDLLDLTFAHYPMLFRQEAIGSSTYLSTKQLYSNILADVSKKTSIVVFYSFITSLIGLFIISIVEYGLSKKFTASKILFVIIIIVFAVLFSGHK
jgi:hypothetical protein